MRKIKFRAWDKLNNRMIVAMDDLKLNMSAFTGDMVDDYILMQYTGLKDKNSKEIYEGDILYSKTELTEILTGKKTGRFKEKYEAVFYEDGCYKTKSTIIKLSQSITGKFNEVVGNIYENKELLDER